MFSIFVCNFHFLEEFTFVVVFQYFYLCCPHISMELGQHGVRAKQILTSVMY